MSVMTYKKTVPSAGTSLESQLPECDNIENWTISREEFVDAAWLAAAIDGEGTITLSQNKARRGYTALVSVCNTDPRFIKRISEIYSKLNVKYNYGYTNRANENRRERLSINCSGLVGVQRVLTFILPYMTCKKEQAECLLSFICWRLDAGFSNGPVIVDSLHENAAVVRAELFRMKHQEFDLQRLKRTASEVLDLG